MTVYIENISAFTPFGNLEQSWKSIVNNEIAYGPITKFDPNASRYTRSKVAGEFHFNAENYPIITEAERDRLPEHMQWALAMTSDLIGDRQLPEERTSVIVSPGFSMYLESLRANRENTDNSYTFCPNMIAHNINIKYGYTGPSTMTMSECSTGIYSIIMGCMLVETGQADYVIAGSVDQCITEDAFKQMGKLRALSTQYNDNPNVASRPWDKNRDGLVLSEGGALFLLTKEKTENTMCEITKYAMTNDAFQVVAPHPEGKHIERCMAQCIDGKPDLINAHATSTPMGDTVELAALNRLGMKDVYITANKSQLGHMMGAAGAVETALSAMSLIHNIVTPSLNIDEVEEGYSPKYVKESTEHEINSVLCNSFGFGGTNASILLRKRNYIIN